jgi:hypothetical protein
MEVALERAEGAYRLVSSTFKKETMSAPGWEGVLLIEDGYFTRMYTRRFGGSASAPSFQCNGGVFTLPSDGKIELVIKFSDFAQLQGMTLVNELAIEDAGERLVMKNADFEEIWERTFHQVPH